MAFGQALVRAKQHYLASTADLRGIHEKSLLQATLFGLPMLSLDFPGNRLPPDAGVSHRDHDPRIHLGAQQPVKFWVSATPTSPPANLQQHQVELKNAERGPNDPPTITATYFSGGQGVITNPAGTRPAARNPKCRRSRSGLVRGIALRGGEYVDLKDVAPTGAATTEIRGVHPAFYPTSSSRPNSGGRTIAR